MGKRVLLKEIQLVERARQVLGLQSVSGIAEIRAAWKSLAGIYHSDRNPDDLLSIKKFQLIN